MDKKTAKKWKLLYVLSFLGLILSVVFAGAWLTSEPSQMTDVKKALAVGFFVLSVVGGLTAKVGSWFFHK
jgi:hypothetical protein